MKKYVLISILILFSIYVKAQTNVLKKEITIQTQDAKLGDVLKKIESIAGVTFAYEATTISRSRRTTISATKMPLENVLKIILYEDGAKFTAVGNQIIIFQANYTQNPLNLIPVRDTIRTTEIVYDTNKVYAYDTIPVYDTIVVKRLQKAIKKPKPTPNFFQIDYEFGYSPFELAMNKNSFIASKKGTQFCNSVNLTIGKSTNNWEIQTGIGGTLIQQTIPFSTYSYNETITLDTVFYTVTVSDSSYITIPGVDTIWLVDTHDVQKFAVNRTVTKETDKQDFFNKNSLYYIRIPIQFSYRKRINQDMHFISSLGTVSNILVSKNYNSITYIHDTEEIKYIKPTPMYLQTFIAMGFDFELQNNCTIQVLPNASFCLSPQAITMESKLANNIQFGIKVGLKKYF